LKRFKGFALPILLLFCTVTCKSTLAQTPGDETPPVDEEVPTSSHYRVTIADPFIELHTGPGSGYPIFYVIDRGTEVNVLRRKTDWYRIETDDGKSGWASRAQMKQTLTPGGEQFKVIEYDQEDFTRRKWVLGVTGGEFEAAPVFTVFTAYSFTENLAAEFHIGQSVGSKSSSTFIKTNLIMQPLPDLTYSPYMSLGLGIINVDPSATLIAQADEENNFSQVGLGIQRFVSRNFLFRLEANEYVIFSSDAIRSDNEVVSEWKFGFAVFF